MRTSQDDLAMDRAGNIRRLGPLALGALLVALALSVFARGLSHGFVVLDDYDKIVENPTVAGYGSSSTAERILTPGQGYVIPVTVAAWALLDDFGSSKAFHLASLATHLVVVLFLFCFLWRRSLPWAAFGAAVLAVHPLVVEPVAWVTGLKDLLAAAFALGATWLFVAGVERGRAGRVSVALAVLVFLLAALSKPTTVLLPGAWLVWLLVRKRAGAEPPRQASIMAGAALLLGLLLGLLSWAGHETIVADYQTPSRPGDGRALLSLGHQVWHLLWPLDLHPLYFLPPGSAWSEWHTWLGVSALAATGYSMWRARLRPLTMLGLSVMVVCYLPVSNLVVTPRQIADSYLYLPLAGAMIALVDSVADRTKQTGPLTLGALLPGVAGTLTVAGLTLLGGLQVERWEGGSALWQPVIERWPGWHVGFNALATRRLREERDAEAAKLYREAYRRGYRAEHLADFGVALAASGQLDDAECVLVEAVRHGNRPEEALRNYGRLLGANPRRDPRWLLAAQRLIPAAMEALEKKGSPEARLIVARLDTLRRRLGPPKTPLHWPRGSCYVLSPFRQ
ncbi:MAG: hypothetical protein RBU30_03150 [Polyangia bacterium]|nr:hypothetical protein [Polyangia bacterium]